MGGFGHGIFGNEISIFFFVEQVVFYVNHMALRYLFNKFELSRQIARWILLLQKFDYEVVYKL